MKHSPTLRLGCALTVLAFGLPSLLSAAQNPPAPAVAKPAVEESAPKPAPFALEIRNGFIMEDGKGTAPATVGAVLDYLKKKDAYFSLSLGPGVAKTQIGDMLLRLPEFDIERICEAIASSSGYQIRTAQIENDSGVWSLYLNDAAPTREVAVFNLTSYLNPDGKADDKTIHEKLASVTDIILKTLNDLESNSSSNLFAASETARSSLFGNSSAAPSFQFHSGANLLVVTGSHRDIQVAGQVANALTRSANDLAYRMNLDRVASNWAANDPAAALEWVQTLPTTDAAARNPIRKAPESSTFNRAQLQAILEKLAAEMKQGSLSPEQMKQTQQHIDELAKQLQNYNRLSTGGGGTSSSSSPGIFSPNTVREDSSPGSPTIKP